MFFKYNERIGEFIEVTNILNGKSSKIQSETFRNITKIMKII